MDFSGCSVLIVDDEPYYRSSIRVAIELTLGAEVIEVDNGSEALDYLKKEKPDLILMDINMPLMDGVTCLERIRKDPGLKDIAVIPYTQESSEEVKKKLYDLGIEDFIIKGIDLDRMISKIEKALQKN
ncbi:response regulator [Bacteroidota bacterium]